MGQVLANDGDSLVFAGGAFTTLPSQELSNKLCDSFATGIGISYDDMSQMEIAKVLGISQMQVSRRLRKALDQLHQILNKQEVDVR